MMDQFNRPDWNSYFISMAFLISQRSMDPATKHGTVVVGEGNLILSTGYNSPPPGCDDSTIPLTRPEKYPYFTHSEENAIISAARNGICLKNSTFYITGHPCEGCFRRIRGVGAKKILYAGVGSACVDEQSFKIIQTLNAVNPIEILLYREDGTAEELLKRTLQYHNERGKIIVV